MFSLSELFKNRDIYWLNRVSKVTLCLTVLLMADKSFRYTYILIVYGQILPIRILARV